MVKCNSLGWYESTRISGLWLMWQTHDYYLLQSIYVMLCYVVLELDWIGLDIYLKKEKTGKKWQNGFEILNLQFHFWLSLSLSHMHTHTIHRIHTHLSMIRERSSCSVGSATLNTTLLLFLAFIIIVIRRIQIITTNTNNKTNYSFVNSTREVWLHVAATIYHIGTTNFVFVCVLFYFEIELFETLSPISTATKFIHNLTATNSFMIFRFFFQL